jgi:hypothetical protein
LDAADSGINKALFPPKYPRVREYVHWIEEYANTALFENINDGVFRPIFITQLLGKPIDLGSITINKTKCLTIWGFYMSKKQVGGCLCGEVRYSVEDDFKSFYQCHCKQCQQLTGSAFASNIITDAENIEWLTGLEKVKTFAHPTRNFSKAFCVECGSAVPFVNKSKTSLIIPAGSLSDAPHIEPDANIFTSEQASWLESGMKAEKFKKFST